MFSKRYEHSNRTNCALFIIIHFYWILDTSTKPVDLDVVENYVKNFTKCEKRFATPEFRFHSFRAHQGDDPVKKIALFRNPVNNRQFSRSPTFFCFQLRALFRTLVIEQLSENHYHYIRCALKW